jgi:hypothetical protein
MIQFLKLISLYFSFVNRRLLDVCVSTVIHKKIQGTRDIRFKSQNLALIVLQQELAGFINCEHHHKL